MGMKKLAFLPVKNETVVVLLDGKVSGTIKRYRSHGGCVVHVPGYLDMSAPPGSRFFKTIPLAKKALRLVIKETERE